MKLRMILALAGAVGIPGIALGADTREQQFEKTVKPYVAKYCAGCHSGTMPAAQLDLKAYSSVHAVVADFPRWGQVLDRMVAQEMPPKPVPRPPEEVSAQVIAWIRTLRAEEIRKNANDPGVVLARRLSNAEYDNSIRDLTGRDLRPAREFPVDPANPAGFDNSGESLTMSPGLLNKYLQAARVVADRMVLTPDKIAFAPYPMLVETDREKFAVQNILSFYLRQPTNYADYFEAAWRYKHRVALGQPRATLASVAMAAKVSPKYLPLVWQILEEKDGVGPVEKLQAMFRALPAGGDGAAVRKQCEAMAKFVTRIRKDTSMQFAAPVVRGLPPASQPLLNWKLKQFAASRRKSDPAALRNDSDPVPEVPKIPRYAGLHMEAAPRWAALMKKAQIENPDLVVPAAERARYEAAFERLAQVFPDQFFVTERGRFFPDDSEDKGRLLSAGYHSVVGFFRDDTPLMELILDAEGQKEINRLWDEFDFIANFTERTWTQYFFNQSGEVYGKGAESASDRPANHRITDPEVIFQLRDAYLAKAAANPANDPIAPKAIREHFDGINATLRRLEKMHKESEPMHLQALLQFAARAYRRPLSKTEADDLVAYYRKLREKNELSHEDAMRNSIVGVLMSPDFLYRIDLLESRQGGAGVVGGQGAGVPLPAYALASRLSYFLWASLPDQELLRHAAAGDLTRRDVLLAQTRRMLKDEKVRGLATEFGGNWLDFRHFETNNSVDRNRFPMFTNELREAMFEEPVRFIEDIARRNASVLEGLYGNYTFVNRVLAKHYRMPDTEEGWRKVEDADRFERGGLLPMAVFLTQNSPGLRTSPVKRGYWLVKRVLGESIPPPPPSVPELPSDEAKSDLPLRDVLAQHRANPACSGCHAKFDVFGLAAEGFGPVGEWRTKDLAGRPVDTHAVFPGGSDGTGMAGVREYIRGHRQADYLDNMSRKLLAYALNRSLQLSDEAVVEKMRAALAANGNRFGAMVETIVTSPQFLTRRPGVAVSQVTPDGKKKGNANAPAGN